MSEMPPPGVNQVHQIAQAIQEQIGQVIVGKARVIDLLLVALFCEGHVLLEDMPGTGKTTLAKALARTLDCSFNRIQFTPDLLPSDIVGVTVFNQRDTQFEYRAGPVVAQIVLADEINRAGPRTQAALLEAMEERQVTVDGVTHQLPYPYMVLATQNPIELEGTFPLPEAQVDRFMMRMSLGYPQREEEREILHRYRARRPLDEVTPVISAEDVAAAHKLCQQVFVHPALEDYLLDLVQVSRTTPEIGLGVSPRGTLALYRAGQALAALHGRDYVIPDDIQQLVEPVLAHRLILSADAHLHGRTTAEAIQTLLGKTAVPVEESWSAHVAA
ncbi:MAG: MoxR family ATPase [Caldilineaceae bacterium]|nr:MoxR family ATPase [Caldilineaceae bacterium]